MGDEWERFVKARVMLVLYKSVDRSLRLVRGYSEPLHYVELVERSLRQLC